MNEQRLYKLLKTCMDPLTDLKGLVKATVSSLCLGIQKPLNALQNEFTRRVEQLSASILPTMLTLLRQASLWIVNTSSIPTLVKMVQKADIEPKKKGKGKQLSGALLAGENARHLLVMISKCIPEMFRPHLSEFVKAIADEKSPRLVECSLQALSALVKNEPSLAPGDK